MLRTIVCTAITISMIILGTGYSWPDDVPFGADSLAYLADEADLIVLATQARPAGFSGGDHTQPLYVTYDVQIGETLRGSASGGQIRVAVPESLDFRSVADVESSILFLSALTAEPSRADQSGTLVSHVLLGGHYGAVAVQDTERLKAIKEYLGDPSSAVNWARTHIVSADEFLQRSAVISLYNQNPSQAVVDALALAANSTQISVENTQIVVRALEASQLEAAVEPLRALASNPHQPEAVRRSAVEALVSVPGGLQELESMTDAEDLFLRELAQSVTANLPR
ncbi:MAG: hypothetical protein EOS34_28045 [Mesorhizobium sp.]|nr:MAG: hypothetical protein EOS34_28045 [Mesorhizobium sp.]